MAYDPPIPETRVLAIASHVVHGYVGNKMATFVMQSLGCDVSAINTVNYSNHTAYKQVKGTKTTAEQIAELYEGLKQSNLNHFDLLLTGYMPSADAVKEVGKIGRDLKYNASTKPGSFFWVLDPVMGDEGKLYIPEDEVPQYKALLREADLILPNQFEAELLSDITITDLDSLAAAIQVLHKTYQVPHIIITSLRLTADNHTISSRAPSSKAASTPTSGRDTPSESPDHKPETSHPASWIPSTEPQPNASTSHPSSWQKTFQQIPEIETAETQDQHTTLTIIGSTSTSTHKPRLFRIGTPQLPLFFSGTGDMFAALTIPRLIEAVHSARTPEIDLASTNSWKSPDDVKPEDLPLAKAVQKVLASMQAILVKTVEKCEEEMKAYDERAEKDGCGTGEEAEAEARKKRHLALMKASEVRVVRFVRAIVEPSDLERFRPRAVVEGKRVGDEVGGREPDELGVVSLGVGGNRGEGLVVMRAPEE